MPSNEWVQLVAVTDFPPGQGRFVEVRGHGLAVFHLSNPDRFVVTANGCPHAGGNLAAGPIAGETVTCPWHHWTFNLETGRCTSAEHIVIRRYESRVEDGYLYARLVGS
ncbi:MAG: Rieske (2Fe-2S) protein [Phycisphaerae bacterium]